mmetsp:Transcript_25967/g.103851  ORF Transcript_25967/g.103851 Transcript_25967/m.103851 type:complete len:104 (-) Transcript_25967:158-469(-)
MVSQHHIAQRERQEEDRRANAAEQRAKQRKDDPNVEYVDVDDYRPGGKRGPPLEDASTTTTPPESSTPLVVPATAAGLVPDALLAAAAEADLRPSSSLWAELL